MAGPPPAKASSQQLSNRRANKLTGFIAGIGFVVVVAVLFLLTVPALTTRRGLEEEINKAESDAATQEAKLAQYQQPGGNKLDIMVEQVKAVDKVIPYSADPDPTNMALNLLSLFPRIEQSAGVTFAEIPNPKATQDATNKSLYSLPVSFSVTGPADTPQRLVRAFDGAGQLVTFNGVRSSSAANGFTFDISATFWVTTAKPAAPKLGNDPASKPAGADPLAITTTTVAR